MKINEFKAIAKEKGIKIGKSPITRESKTKIVREIQLLEGNFDCFGTALSGYCDQHLCIWREDCLDLNN